MDLGCVWEAHFALPRHTFAFQIFFFFPSYNFFTFLPWTVLPCTVHRFHKLHFSITFSLKIGPTVLFTHLKIILLQCFQFSVFSCIQTDPYHVGDNYHCSHTVAALFTHLKILKMGLKVLFTHLKIILLQYFQFSVFNFQFLVSRKISCIQTDP